MHWPGEARKQNEGRDGASGSEPRGGRPVSLSDIIFPAESNSDASHDGPRSDGEDSDYDEELELDFETSMSGDDEHNDEPNALHGSSNPRIHRISDSAGESVGPNGSCGSPSSSSSHNDRVYQVSFNFSCKAILDYVAAGGLEIKKTETDF